MSITLDAGFDDQDKEVKTDFSVTRDPFRLGGRAVNQEPTLNPTDIKTGWVTKKAMEKIGISGGGGIRIDWGGDKGLEVKIYIDTEIKNDKGDQVSIHVERNGNGKGHASLDGKTYSEFDFDSKLEFDMKTGQERN